MYEGGIGLSDKQISKERQNMLSLADSLRNLGAQSEIDIPQIVVIGSQSAGKSSLIQRITGIQLPRSSRTRTRVPTEIRLKQSHPDDPWQCSVSVRFTKDAQGTLLSKPKNVDFGPIIYDPNEVRDRVARAQNAILNPSQPCEDFLCGQVVESDELYFSENCVSVQIQGPGESDLSLCDLPGLNQSFTPERSKYKSSEYDNKRIEDLVKSYIKNPNRLILLTVDFETQSAYELAKDCDPKWNRTIGVLTNPDRIADGDQDRWIQILENKREPLDLRWFCVKQPNTAQLQQNITWKEAADKETEFFRTEKPWCSLRPSTTMLLGIQPLIEHLSRTLSNLIAGRLPKLKEDVDGLLRRAETSLKELPAAPKDNSVAEAMQIIVQFSSDIEKHISGSPTKDGLIQKINCIQVKLKREILSLAPHFIPYKSGSRRIRLPEIEFLEKEEEGIKNLGHTQYYIDEVMKLINENRTQQLPGLIPFNVSISIIATAMAEWKAQAASFFEAVFATINEFLKDLVNQYFKPFEYGGLLKIVRSEVQQLLERLGDHTKLSIDKLLEQESTAFTLNAHCLARYKDDFLAYYKGCRQMESNNVAMEHVQEYTRLSSSTGIDLNTISNHPVSRILSGLNTMNIRDVKASDLLKLLPKDPYEPALELMAIVSAYYQGRCVSFFVDLPAFVFTEVSSRRFVDNVSLVVNFDFAQAFAHSIQNALLAQINQGDSRERCALLLREFPRTRILRDNLQEKLKWLSTTKRELMEYDCNTW
ncbi:P-loop containing nucleoside triphosphate hydrolase protein [Phellopilus nigrolimitatus]|nr:P-loop containing nucleoside triphosphate hydrolase protein [Phellopilus nigrolimitatus]